MPPHEPRTLIVSVDKAGHVNQCLAFCEAIGWAWDERIVRIPAPGRMTTRWRRFWLKRRRRAATAAAIPKAREPGRLRIVASGAAAEAVVAAYRTLYGADLFAVFVGAPHAAEPIFDVSIVAHHALEKGETPDTVRIPAGGTLVWMRGVYVRTNATVDAQERRGLGVIVGGVNKAFAIDADRIASQTNALIADMGPSAEPVTVVFSRRTPPAAEAKLRAALASAGARFVDRSDRDGYVALLASAAAFATTPDSISMICDACATGQPVTTFDLACFDRDVSTFRFFSDMTANGYVGLAGGPAASRPAPETAEVTGAVERIHTEWIGRRPAPSSLTVSDRTTAVMPGLDPGIQPSSPKRMDCRVKPGNDGSS